MPSRNGTILLVEDDPDDAELAIAALEGAKVLNSIEHAHDGVEALQYLFEAPLHPLPTVVLLDLKMPKVNGLDVLKRIRSEKRTRTLPVVVLTSSKEDRDIRACYELGVNSYIVKPVDFEQFVSCVKQLGLYWVVLNTVLPVE
jgi:two-component system response regulator